MKIVIIGTAYPYRGGLAAFNERIAKEFVSQGHNVRIETFTLQYPSFLFPGKTQYSEEPAPAGLNIVRSVNSCNPFNWISVGRRIKKECPDLVIIKFWLPFMAPCFGTIARIIRSNGKTKVVSILDNIIPHEKRIGDKMFASYFTGSVDGFVAMSESVLKDTEQFDTVKPKIFCRHPLYDNFGEPMTREESLTKLGLDQQYKYLLFFGIIRDYKGLDLLLKAYADSRIDKTKTKLLVAGEFYGNEDKYRVLEKSLGLEGMIEWHTYFIPDSKVRDYFCAADLIVQPYKSATQSGVTQIAYHFEKPMLVTNVGGLSEIVPNGKVGYVTEPDETKIADAIVSFVNEDNKDLFSEGLKEEKKKYGWDKMANAVIESSRQ